MTKRYSELGNELVSAANGVDYAYRDTGGGEDAVPLVLLQHFRGNLDNWDPALIDVLATARRVVTFDNAGVGGSTGTTPDTIEQMARDALAFLAAMGTRGAVLPGRPAPRTQVCSRAGVMMSTTEKSLANCSGVPNIAAMHLAYLVR